MHLMISTEVSREEEETVDTTDRGGDRNRKKLSLHNYLAFVGFSLSSTSVEELKKLEDKKLEGF